MISFEFDSDAAKSCKSLKCCQFLYSEKAANPSDRSISIRNVKSAR